MGAGGADAVGRRGVCFSVDEAFEGCGVDVCGWVGVGRGGKERAAGMSGTTRSGRRVRMTIGDVVAPLVSSFVAGGGGEGGGDGGARTTRWRA